VTNGTRNPAPKADLQPTGRKDAHQILLAIPTHLWVVAVAAVAAVVTGTNPHKHCHNLNMILNILEARLVLHHQLV
jgi:hypothetical protein